MSPTQQEIEAKIRKLASLMDTVGMWGSILLDTAGIDAKKLDHQARLLGMRSVAFLKRQKLALEIRLLKRQLAETEKRIAVELEQRGMENTRPS